MQQSLGKKQHGVVLVVALVFLTILTIAVLSSNSSTLLQEKMTIAVKEANIAMERAEHALREAEVFIDGQVNLADIESSSGYYASGLAPDPFTSSTWSNNVFTASNGSKYIIENVGTVFDKNNLGQNTIQVGDVAQETVSVPRIGFRIVARGAVTAGDEVQAQRILVSYFAKRF